MDGSGCKNCPAYQKCTARYRSSRCSHNRATYGVYSDPFTNADRIRAMSDEDLAELFGAILREREIVLLKQLRDQGVEASIVEIPGSTFNAHLEWLQQPAEVVDDG